MQVLTDNYTRTTEFVQPLSTNLSRMDRDLTNTSLVIFSGRIGYNFKILKQLEEYSNLSENWDGEDALPPDVDAISKATSLVKLLELYGQRVYHTAPGPNGEVMLDIRNSSLRKSVEILFYPNKSVIVYLSDNEIPKQEDFKDSHLPEILQWLNNN